jgi:hypothetical protein
VLGNRSAETTGEVAKGMREFRLALVEDITSGASVGPTWEQSVDQCASGQGSWNLLLALWTELNHWVACWLDARELPQPVVLPPEACRALTALRTAARRGEDCLVQVPCCNPGFSCGGLRKPSWVAFVLIVITY